MANNNDDANIHILVTPKQLVIAAMVILFGSNTTGLLNAFNPNIRADAFTMTDWLNEKAEIVQIYEEHKDETSNHILRLQLIQQECVRLMRKNEENFYNKGEGQ